VTERYDAVGEDPLTGIKYTYPATRTVQGRPHLNAGLAGAGVIALSSAIEAFVYARKVNTREQRVSATLLPSANGVALSINLR
jgi:hypothetical protein